MRYFVAVAEALSFTKAAENLRLAQPSLTRQIKDLETEIGVRIDLNFDYGSLTSLVSRADQTIDTEQIAEQWDRMGQLYASLKTGHVTASVALKRLGPDTTMIGNESERQH